MQDINIRLHKHPQVNHRTIVQNDCQWKLHQVIFSDNFTICNVQFEI